MKIKTAELTGAALDWAVAKCEGLPVRINKYGLFAPEQGEDAPYFVPSADWSQAGPIIEREEITLVRCDDESIPDERGFHCGIYEPRWAAVTKDRHSNEADYSPHGDDWGKYYKVSGSAMRGPTPLIAAMRCYVASKLGDEVEIPEELL
jgi:hypothetical protein